MNRRSLALPVILLAASATLAGCASGSPQTASTGAGTIAVVASTNVWGDLAATVGGEAVTVTSIIDSPDKDPHEYEADARNQLALSKAGVVIRNGGGYDDFVDTMLASTDNSSATVIDAVEVSGRTGDGLNEHVWYDLPAVRKVVGEIESALSAIDPANADSFARNADALTARIAALEKTEGELKASYAGESVAITEPVPVYMLDAIGLVNRTPDEFSEAVEEDTDVAPAVLQETIGLFAAHEVVLLVYNEQTAGPQTDAVLAAARQNGIAVVPVTETLPDSMTYVSWMTDNLDAIKAALAR